eukprot:1636140-Prorocentrum_lima.AAC.1
MTSSLVGSEMCIRDRPPAPNLEVVVQLVLAADLNLSFLNLVLSLLKYLTCLLYTSDAADDM